MRLGRRTCSESSVVRRPIWLASMSPFLRSSGLEKKVCQTLGYRARVVSARRHLARGPRCGAAHKVAREDAQPGERPEEGHPLDLLGAGRGEVPDAELGNLHEAFGSARARDAHRTVTASPSPRSP